MRVTIDTEARTLRRNDDGEEQTLPLYSPEGFSCLADLFLQVGWDQKHVYTFTWFGRPIIQFPEDLIRLQEVIYHLRPDVIVETGIAHGGSLVYYASLFEAMHHGRVIGVDIEIRPHNRAAIEAHDLFHRITLLEGGSTEPAIVRQIDALIRPGETVLVILDSNHTRDYVLAELDAYHHLVTPGSYIVATDGIMRMLTDVPRGKRDWGTDNPAEAARLFAAAHPEFSIVQPVWHFNESRLTAPVTHWPDAWLRRMA